MLHDYPYGKIFEESIDVRFPFCEESWLCLMFPETLPRSVAKYFAPLSAMAQRIGDDHIMLADEREPSTRVRSSWDPEEFRRRRFELPLGALGFGVSERWGAVFSEHDFTVVGGEPGLVLEVANALGGLERIRDEFDAFLEEALGVDFDKKVMLQLRALSRREQT